MKFIPVILKMLLVSTLLMLTACNEDNPIAITPIDTTYQYDSARFNWKVDTLLGDGYYYKLWAPDTNEIFIANQFTNTLAHIKNGVKTLTQYPQENRLGAVFGDESNKGYRVGAISVGSIYQPLIQKWDGNNFVNINNPQNLDRNFYYWAAYIKDENEMWIGLTDGTVVNYNGSTFTLYDLSNPNLVFTEFFYDETNRLKFLAYDPHYYKGYTEYLVYELDNNQWKKIFRDSVNDIIGPIRYNDIIGKRIAPLGPHQIYELVDSTPIPRISVPVYVFHLALAGSSFNNILIAGFERFPGCNASLFHWDGEKWSSELCNYSTSDVRTVMMINNNFYVVTYFPFYNETYIIRGTKNTNQKNLKN